MGVVSTFRGKQMKMTIEPKEGEPYWAGSQWLVHPLDCYKAMAEGDIYARFLES